jgi:ferredoxin
MMGGVASEEGAPDSLALGEYLPGPGPLPWTLRIETMDCVACHACIQVCPSGALQLEGDEPGAKSRKAPCYRLEHAKCMGCGLCVDVCQTGAIKLHACSRPDQIMVLLHESVCRSCGARYQVPAARMDEAGTCWVCARGRPALRLYQVMDVEDAGQALP